MKFKSLILVVIILFVVSLLLASKIRMAAIQPRLSSSPVTTPTPTPASFLTGTDNPGVLLTPTRTRTETSILSPTPTSPPTATRTKTPSATPTKTPTATATRIPTRTATRTHTPAKTFTATVTRTPTFTPVTLVAEMMAQVRPNDIFHYTGSLSGEWATTIGGKSYTITSRATNSGVPIQKATQYVYEHLQAWNLSPVYQDWSSSGLNGRNVTGVITGDTHPDEIVLLTAHLDDNPSSGPAPGADDNASGSAGVLVAAEILSQYHFERSLRFVFFTGEEQGMLGSHRYAALARANGENIVAVCNLDMIGWDDLGGPVLRVHTRPGSAGDLAIAKLLTNVVSAYHLDLTPVINADGESTSDHSSFWNQGYPAILAIEDKINDLNQVYHSKYDRMSTLNQAYFTEFVKTAVGTVAHLARPH